MRTLACLQILNEVRAIPGDVLELGVAWGATALTMAIWMRENTRDKTLFACDTFTGLPRRESAHLFEGRFNFSDVFQRSVNLLPLTNVRTLPGRIEVTLPEHLSERKFCFAWLDLDLYESTSFAARWLTDRITPGGVIGFHDYRFERCPGIAKVVDEELDRDKFDLLRVDWNCAFLRRK